MKNLVFKIIILFKLKKITLILLWLGLFFCFCLIFNNKILAQTTSPDAIAIRVLPNFEHYSAQYWYGKQGFGGSPQALTVDGYEAVRDGRTVYVNVANVAAGELYTNIYLISFNQDAESATRDIFANILSHWKFNTNLTAFGRCRGANSIVCLSDDECPIKDFCNSVKVRVVRDTRRLSDLAGIKISLNNYKARAGFFPKLAAGTYLPRRSLSVWPSWQDNLAQELGVYVPVDPVNKLGPCPGYNEITCWNEDTKRFAGGWPDFTPNSPDLPDSSLAYTYTVNALGSFYDLCMVSESGLAISGDSFCILDNCLDFDGDGYGLPGSSQCTYPETDCDDTDPAIGPATGPEQCAGGLDEDCDGFVDCADSDCYSDPACTAFGECNHNGICEDGQEGRPDRGETCDNCPEDYCCGPHPCGDGFCDEGCGECDTCYGPGLDCECGNGVVECAEECDDGNTDDGDGCSSICLIAHSPCRDYDGDGYYAIDAACPTGNDCDDNNADINPGEAEVCDGVDNNCDGAVDEGYNEENCGFLCSFNYDPSRAGDLRCCGDDPGEGGPYENPEVSCDDGQDNDCDGTYDDDLHSTNPDNDCLPCLPETADNETFYYVFGEPDCNQCDHPGDDDGNQGPSALGLDWETDYPGMADACDPNCPEATVAASSPPVHIDVYETSEASCSDGIDNDCDGFIDCADLDDCGASPDCCDDDCAAGSVGCVDTDTRWSCGEAGDGDPCLEQIEVDCAVGEECNSGVCEVPCTDDCAAGSVGCVDADTRWSCGEAGDGDPCLEEVPTDCGVGEVCNAGVCVIGCVDNDGDGHYAFDAVNCPTGDDCNDDPANGGAFCYPGNTETCDGYDNDCDGTIDEGCDDDGDGYCDSAMQLYNNNNMCLNTVFTGDGMWGDDCDDDPAACGANCNPGIANEIPNSTCADTYDNDCDGNADCADTPACDSDPSCTNNCIFTFTFPCVFP